MFSFDGFGPGCLSEFLIGRLILVEFELEVQQSITGVEVNHYEKGVEVVHHVIFFTGELVFTFQIE
jgi:hypothetical protein